MSPARIIILVVALVAGLGAALLMQRSPEQPVAGHDSRSGAHSAGPGRRRRHPARQQGGRQRSALARLAARQRPCRRDPQGRDARGRSRRSPGSWPATRSLASEPIRREKLIKHRRHRLPLRRSAGWQARHRDQHRQPRRRTAGGFILPMTASMSSARSGAEGTSGGGRRPMSARSCSATSACWRSARTSRSATARRW